MRISVILKDYHVAFLIGVMKSIPEAAKTLDVQQKRIANRNASEILELLRDAGMGACNGRPYPNNN